MRLYGNQVREPVFDQRSASFNLNQTQGSIDDCLTAAADPG